MSKLRLIIFLLSVVFAGTRLAAPGSKSLHQTETVNARPVVLKKLEAKLDTANAYQTSETGAQGLLKGKVEELRNLDLTLSKTDWNRLYSIGRQAYVDGDFRRAFNAFQLALLKQRGASGSDPRVVMTRQALDSVRSEAETLPARAGYKQSGGKVEAVFPGSLAWLAGVRRGDRITAAHSAGSLITMTVERNKKSYAVTLNDLTVPFSFEKGQKAEQSFKLHGQITDLNLLAKNETLLADHDAVILIDKSGSMSAADCPGGVSKWQWCKDNTLALLQSAGKYFQNRTTIVPFDSHFQVFQDANLSEVARVFQEFAPSGGTQMAAPLSYELDDYFLRKAKNKHTKPVIVVVITDGIPNDPDDVRDVIYNATGRMSAPQEVCITFLQVGSSFHGGRFLSGMVDNLVNAGARYGIVDTTSFDDLERIGMKNALVAALLKARSSK